MLFKLASVVLLFAPLVMGEARFERVQGEKNHGSYIVKMKQGLSRSSVLSKIGESSVKYKYNKELINGFAGKFDEKTLALVRADPDVEAVYEDGIASIAALATQTNAPWGLERISKAAKITAHSNSLSYTYTRDTLEGQGVDVYVLDTGVYVEHVEFEGRARWGASFSSTSPAQVDNHGHGTHCAGTIGSRAYGVAKKASIIAVKVLSDGGSGAWSDIIAGMNYVIQQKAITGRPSVISMSIGGGGYQPVDDAVVSVTNAGIHFIVAAGNNNGDTANYSPGRAPSAVTVGAMDINDAKASFSNYGSLVDIHAPGVNVISSYIGSTTATGTLSGTSMATPHVAGLVAYLISLYGDKTPANMSAYLQSTSIKNAITGLPSGTVNYLATNGPAGKVSRRELLGRNMFE